MYRTLNTLKRGWRKCWARSSADQFAAEETHATAERARDKPWEDDAAQKSFLQVLGWSGALALGWQFVYPLSRFINCFINNDDKKRECKCILDASTLLSAAGFSHLKSVSSRLSVLPSKYSKTASDSKTEKGSTSEELYYHIEAAGKEFAHTHKLLLCETSLWNGNGWFQLGSEGYEEAAGSWELAASLGSHEASFYLGFLYQHGLGVPQDKEKAVQHYSSAADEGHPNAMYHLGEMLLEDSVSLSNSCEGLQLLNEAAKHGVTAPVSSHNLIHDIVLQKEDESLDINLSCENNSEEDNVNNITEDSVSPVHLRHSASFPQLCLHRSTPSLPVSKSLGSLSSEEAGYFTDSTDSLPVKQFVLT